MRIQKGKVRFSKRDLWNLDETLKPILRTALTQFRDAKKMGVSTLIYEDYIADERGITIDEAAKWIDEHRDMYGKIEGFEGRLEEMVEYFHNVILEDMIYAFSDHPDYMDIEEQPFDISFERTEDEDGNVRSNLHTKMKDGVTQEDYNSYREREREYDKKVHDRCERGRFLFARYFHALWD